LSLLDNTDWTVIAGADAQNTADSLQGVLTNILDNIAPLKTIRLKEGKAPSIAVTRLQKKYRNIFKKTKKNGRKAHSELREIAKTIKQERFKQEHKTIRERLLKNPNDLWRCVNISLGKNNDTIPAIIKEGDKHHSGPRHQAQAFAKFFQRKVASITSTTKVAEHVFNGNRVIEGSHDMEHVSQEDVLTIMQSLKRKKCYGTDGIPLILFCDGALALASIVTFLINQIFHEKEVPIQWKTARLIPLHKKGRRDCIENYRPISNLCSLSKIFELTLKSKMDKISEIERVDLTGDRQYGFKKCKSTITACLDLQHTIASGCDSGEVVVAAGVDLSSAFDVVSVGLLLLRLRIMGFPEYITDILRDWLTGRKAYVEINNETSDEFNVDDGTIQGSINGPDLYSLYVAPLLQIRSDLQSFADDNVNVQKGRTVKQALDACVKATEEIIQWFRDSGLAVNPEKTEVCLFSNRRLSQEQGSVIIDNKEVRIKETMKILGVYFDSTMTWKPQLEYVINNAVRTKRGMGIIAKYMTEKELRLLSSSLFYSRLYYASEVWLGQSLNSVTERRLNSLSKSMLQIVSKGKHQDASCNEIHVIYGQPLPKMQADYSTAKALHNITTSAAPESVFISLIHNSLHSNRFKGQQFASSARLKIGRNSIANRVTNISKTMNIDWPLMPKSVFKTYAKRTFVTGNDN
jgi:predicted DNA-binding antitoxin AbrB/MazE fold protein